METSPDKHNGVKAIHINRARIKERIQAKHRQQSEQVRQGRLSEMREASAGCSSSNEEQTQWLTSVSHPHCSLSGMCSAEPPSSSNMRVVNADGTPVLPVVQDWSDIGREFGVNVLDTDVMEYLLALEDEIRQEQLFQFYDQTNGSEWEEYYRSLSS